mmetsp:Transcript_1652/g.2994  ORF Transcript_1652/g.2994 Transcript_1652/m.2994 type:complete len:315 (-) Transcript_1652:70-1014(-)
MNGQLPKQRSGRTRSHTPKTCPTSGLTCALVTCSRVNQLGQHIRPQIPKALMSLVKHQFHVLSPTQFHPFCIAAPQLHDGFLFGDLCMQLEGTDGVAQALQPCEHLHRVGTRTAHHPPRVELNEDICGTGTLQQFCGAMQDPSVEAFGIHLDHADVVNGAEVLVQSGHIDNSGLAFASVTRHHNVIQERLCPGADTERDVARAVADSQVPPIHPSGGVVCPAHDAPVIAWGGLEADDFIAHLQCHHSLRAILTANLHEIMTVPLFLRQPSEDILEDHRHEEICEAVLERDLRRRRVEEITCPAAAEDHHPEDKE